MATSQKTPIKSEKPSALERFSVRFEYDRTWSEAKRTVRHNPAKHR